jgi:hypothetical protein
MSKSKIKHVFCVPTVVPANRVLVHNSADHDAKTVPGTGGFRAWFDVPYHKYATCSCGWAPHLGTHYWTCCFSTNALRPRISEPARPRQGRKLLYN